MTTKLVLTLTLVSGCAVDEATIAQHTTNAPILLPESGTGQAREVMSSFDPLVVTLTDTYGDPLSGVTITFTSPQAGASSTFQATGQATTDEVGRAELRPHANSVAGTYTVWAHADGAAPMPFVLTNEAASPAVIFPILGDNQVRSLNQPFPYPLTIEVRDNFGNVVPDVPVVFEAPTAGATTAMMNNDGATVTNVDGLAAMFVTAGHIPGSYEVTTRVTGAPSVSFDLRNMDGMVFPELPYAHVVNTRATQR